ncbi:hypothetical protein L6164_003990 [Bauhinia variegata]|uniref:Uncharacterized protein n=1 Tax=Bauhinia variegata TaxID=167791 RepID=A0ACB9Q313_BAUVA|nr:hypothetical protein L6164_003990 [Bauhinia variegata]
MQKDSYFNCEYIPDEEVNLTDDTNLLEKVHGDEICIGDGSFLGEDLSHLFSIDQTFTTRYELLKWVRAIRKRTGFVIVIDRSEIGGEGKRTHVKLVCEHGGKYRPRITLFCEQIMAKTTLEQPN